LVHGSGTEDPSTQTSK
ncbi:hypothetical protein CISIN_1g0487441mg, partial [Citrus sinensis]